MTAMTNVMERMEVTTVIKNVIKRLQGKVMIYVMIGIKITIICITISLSMET